MNSHPDSTAGGDWLFQLGGMLYGPVPARLLLEKVEAGEIGADTPVARDGEAFRRMGDEPAFAVQVARAAARLRVEAQARADGRARGRRRITWIASLVVAALLLAGGAVRLVIWAEATGLFAPDVEALAALEISTSLPTIELGPLGAADEEEFLDYLEPEPAAAAKKRRGVASTAARKGTAATAADPDGLTTHARYDQSAIQAVLAKEQRSLYPCLQEQARRDPGFRGQVPLSFTVANDGRVGRIWIDRPGLEDGPLFTCFSQKMQAWRFPAFAGERPSISLSFRVGS